MSRLIYLLGPAGSGKSTLALSLLEAFDSLELDCITVNLDPGAEWLPYTPDIDIRKDISLTEVMRRFRLGPNGALVASIDMLVEHIPRLREIIHGMNPDYAIIDTPGQMELFAFRETGPAIVKSLGEESLTVFLADSFLARSPCSFVSLLVLSLSAFVRFRKPQIVVLSKSDLLEKQMLEKIINWWENRDSLLEDIQSEPNPLHREVAQSIFIAIKESGLPGEIIPVSGITGDGVDNLVCAIERVFSAETELDLGKETETV